MLSFLGSKSEKDLGDKLLGKMRRFRFPRHGAVVTVYGRLLAYYRCNHEPDGLMPPANGRVELMAVFLTRAGRYLVYYIVSYPETEDIAGRHEYIHALESLTAISVFLAAMRYPNKGDFEENLLAQALTTLEHGQNRGKRKTGKTPVPTPHPETSPDVVAESAADAAESDVPPPESATPQQSAVAKGSDPANASGV